MRLLIGIVCCLGVMALAVWAYQENYRTKHAIAEMTALEREIGRTRATLAVMAAEWAYLNRPARLRELAEMNFDRLRLVPMAPERFGPADEVPYAPSMTAMLEDAL